MTTKKFMSAVLAGILALSSLSALTACNTGEKGPVKSKRTNVYRGTDIPLPDGIDYISNLMVGGEKIYLVYSKEVERPYDPEKDGSLSEITPGGDIPVIEVAPVEDESVDENEAVYYDYVTCVYVSDMDGANGAEYELQTNGNAYVNAMAVDAEGTLWIMEQEWWNNEDYTESKTLYTLYPFQPETDETNTLDLNAAIDASGLVNEGDYYYINRFHVADGQVTFALENGIITCDATTGEVVGKCPVDDGWVSGMMISGSEMYFLVYPNNGDATIRRFDAAAGTLTKVESEVLTDLLMGGYNPDGTFPAGKLYFRNSSGIEVYDIATDTKAELINYINCDIDSSSVNNVRYTTDGRLVGYYTEWVNNESKTHCTIYERIPDEEMEEEVIITLASTYNNYQVRRSIIRFNKKNTGVRVAMNTYDSYNNEENNWTGAVTQINADLASGKVPDILVIDSSLPAESYFRQNMFIDLNPYVDGENGIDRGVLLDNILRASESRGKLYSIIPSFHLYTLAAKTQYVGTEPGWTLAEMMNTINAMPEEMAAFMEYSRDQVVENMLTNAMDAFINWETGETYFNTPEFLAFIEYAKTLPEKGYWESYYDGSTEYDPTEEMQRQEQFDLRFYKDKALFFMQYLSDFNGYTNAVQTFATDEITFIGYPTREENSNGATIVPDMELAISAKSSCKDEAWSFLKFLITDEETLAGLYSFTLNKDSLERFLKQTEEQNDYYWEMTEEDYAWYYETYSEEYVEYLKNSRRKYTAEDGAKVMDILTGVTRIARTDTKMTEIIKEELSGFFGGTKTAEATADAINSRVRMYVSENS